MAPTKGKRKLPRRSLEYIGDLLDHLPYSHLPTNHVVLQRLLFILETEDGTTSLQSAVLTVQKEICELWAYAGYEDILHHPANIRPMITKLHTSYKSLLKVPISRRAGTAFLSKLDSFTSSLPSLFSIYVKDQVFSSRITDDDRTFLLHHWRRVISSTRDVKLQKSVEKKLARREKLLLSETPGPSISTNPPPTSPSPSSSSPTPRPASPDTEYHPK